MTVLNDIGTLFQGLGLGVLATTLFKGRFPLDAPGSLVTHAAMALIEVPGLPPERVHDGPLASTDHPMIQVLTRGNPHDYEEPRARAETAFLAVDGLVNLTLSGTFYRSIFAQQPPRVLVQEDAMGRTVIAFVLHCAKSR